MAYNGNGKNEYGTPISLFTCEFCGNDFSVCPAIKEDRISEWDNGGCQSPECVSYDPDRDADIFFMTDEEIAKEKPLVSIKQLLKRKNSTMRIE